MELDQLIVQKKWNGRKRSETVGNGRKHDQAKTCPTRISEKKHFRATHFFLKVQRCPRGNGWKQSEIAPSLGKKDMLLHNFQTRFMNICYKTTTFLPSEGAIPDCFQPFPLGHLWTFKKKCVARKCFFVRNAGWTSFGLIMFPTISDRFRPFHFFWTINWSNSIYGRLIQSKPVQTMMLKFFRATLVRVHCTKYCILTLISNIP